MLELRITAPTERLLAMNRGPNGYYGLLVDGIEPGARYFYRIEGKRDRPDPASRFQPDGVHGASAVVDSTFAWTDDNWHGIPLHAYITYELHIGTFSVEGTFDAAIAHLDELVELGITAIELMPVGQFPGGRNWGYDGVHPFAVQNTYGGPDGLKRLINAAHARGIAVVMDVVYNHLGPEGNYFGEFGEYYTDRHHTTWGRAINFDGRGSDAVRRFFIENALFWIDEFHVDALRIDAVHAIFDTSAQPFLRELADAVRLEGRRLDRHVFTIAESNLNDPRMVQPSAVGGYGIDAQWSDDFHHALRTELTGERAGYFEDFHGFPDIIKSLSGGFAQTGEFSTYRGCRHGASAHDVPPKRFVVCAQNHDQIGNRPQGERLTSTVFFEQLKLAAATVLLSPYQPLLFMGDEYGETAPFLYFISHIDPALVEAVRRGRKREFEHFQWATEPPDPFDEATFNRCKLNRGLMQNPKNRTLREFYRELIALRRSISALLFADRTRMEIAVIAPNRTLAIFRSAAGFDVVTILHYAAESASVAIPLKPGTWQRRLSSADKRWQGPGDSNPKSFESTGSATLSLAPRSALLLCSAESDLDSFLK